MQRQVLVVSFFCFAIFTGSSQTQPVYTYQQLSKSWYAAQKDSLKKAWVCPEIYPARSVQKKFREIWDQRTDFLTASIENQHFLYEPEVYSYLQNIIDQLIAGNPQRFGARPLLLIDRSPVANAYALGNNVLVVNLGLICFSQTREELALAIAHELSHNLLNHPENAMRETAEWLSSDEYRNSLNQVLDSKYGRYSRLKKTFETYSFSRSRHQRYHEADADSLAVILLKNSHISFNSAYFLRLDSSDIQYREPLKKPLQDYFTAYNLTVDDGWMQTRSKGLSTKAYNFTDQNPLDDSLKTHPDCIERYHRTQTLSDPGAIITPLPPAVSGRVEKMLIWNMFDEMSLTACLYRILQQKDKGRTDGWYDFMVYNVFAGLYYTDKDLHRFNAVDIKPKEYISGEYYQLQTMLQQMPAESLRQYYTALDQASFWSSRSMDERALKDLITALCAAGDDQHKARRNTAEAFVSNNSTSMYCEFADQFKKK
jgi:hypothetical protein